MPRSRERGWREFHDEEKLIAIPFQMCISSATNCSLVPMTVTPGGRMCASFSDLLFWDTIVPLFRVLLLVPLRLFLHFFDFKTLSSSIPCVTHQLVRTVRHAMAQRERRRFPGLPEFGFPSGQKGWLPEVVRTLTLLELRRRRFHSIDSML